MSAGWRYLATPYSKFPGGHDASYAETCWIASRLWRAGIAVYSPIIQTHSILKMANLPPDFGFWAVFDEALIAASDGMIVAMMPGWEQSEGIACEIVICGRLGKPVTYLDPVTLAMRGAP